METRANYVLIGACTLAGILLGLGFFVWLAKVQIDRRYAYYDVLFDNVAGLSRAGEVRFNGLPVGQVLSLGIDQDDSGMVRVRVQVDADTPIHEGATAQLQAQGVTGVSAVALDGGDANKPLLRTTVRGVPTIEGQRSVVQSLAEDAPDLLAEAIKLVKELQAMVGPGNQAKVAGILANVDQASSSLETALADFSRISRSVADATGQISTFTGRLGPLAESVGGALGAAQGTMAAMSGAFGQAETTLGTADTALKTVRETASAANGLIRSDGAAAVTEMKLAVTGLRELVDGLGTEAHGVLAAYGTTAAVATARLTQLDATIAALDTAIGTTTTTLASVDAAATSFDDLVDGDGTALVSEARATLASLNTSTDAIEKAATEDLPAVVAEVRQAIGTVNATIDRVSADVTGFTGDMRPVAGQASQTLASAAATFESANATLARLEPAIASAERTMAAAEGAFTGAERIIDQNVGPAAADLRASAERMSVAVESVSAELPAVAEELRTTLGAATETVRRIDAIVKGSAGPIGQFSAEGLPQFVRFTQQAQALVSRLDRIAAQLERDPARFLLGNPAPEFRR